MKISDFDYNLPEDKIAIYPPEVRGSTRLLVLNKNTGDIEHKRYSDLADYLEAGDVLVLNDTKVLKARIDAVKETGGKVELLALEKHGDKNSQFVMYRGHLKAGDRLSVKNYELRVKNLFQNGTAEVSSNIDLYEIAEQIGHTPIPPYLNRESDELDEERYQTIFAKELGSVAAPTASLNFTDELKEKLIAKGIKIKYLTLHVGIGTFMPIRTDNVEEHKMHSEFYIIPKETLEEIRNAKHSGRKVAAIGTTVTRTLEHAKDLILSSDEMRTIVGEADIFIYPGYEFKIVDKLITNFHAPRTTVLMLAATFAGWENLKKAYESAIENDYKFLSYGDSMVIQ